jgi:hypothetical protein
MARSSTVMGRVWVAVGADDAEARATGLVSGDVRERLDAASLTGSANVAGLLGSGGREEAEELGEVALMTAPDAGEGASLIFFFLGGSALANVQLANARAIVGHRLILNMRVSLGGIAPPMG